MGSPIAWCEACGHVFEFAAIELGATVSLRMSDNMTVCPSCGHPAKIADGLFSIADGELKLIDGPAITREMMVKLAALRRRIASGEITTEQAAREAEAMKPGLGNWLTMAIATAGGLASIAGIAAYVEGKINPTISAKQGDDLISELRLTNSQLADMRKQLVYRNDRPDAKAMSTRENRHARRAEESKKRRADRASSRAR